MAPPKRRSRIRHILKWIGTLVCLSILVAWGFAGWWDYWIGTATSHLNCGGGSLSFEWIDIRGFPFRLEFGERDRQDIVFFPRAAPGYTTIYAGAGFTRFSFSIPIAAVFVLAAVPTAALWWRDRRGFPPRHCQACGYDLSGSVTGRCSECGAPFPNPFRTRDRRD